MNLSDSLDFPCSITAENSYINASGSAFNQALSAARCGAKVSLIGVIGNDFFGNTILDTLRREGIQKSGITKSDLPTSILNSITNIDNKTASIALKGASAKISPYQIPDNLLNEKSLILLQNDVALRTNTTVLKRAQKGKAMTIMCFNHNENIDDSLFDYLDIAIISDDTSAPTNVNTRIVLNKHKNKSFDSFCGYFSACIQAGMNIDKAIEYGDFAAKLTDGHNFPYLCDIEDSIKDQ